MGGQKTGQKLYKKAKNKDSKGAYYQSNIESWNTDNQFDIVFSMETFYYLKNIDKELSKISSKYLTHNIWANSYGKFGAKKTQPFVLKSVERVQIQASLHLKK